MIYFDLETTGVNLLRDRIIEIYALKIEGENRNELHHFINPGIPIPPEATAIHGYTNDFVNDKPRMQDVIQEIDEFFEGQNLIGYNNRNFDNLLLSIEFTRCGHAFRLEERKIIDVYEMWSRLEPRNLAGAYKRFCDKTSDDLHGAKEDVKVVTEVYNKILEVFALQDKSFEEISNISCPDENSLCFGKLLKDGTGNLIFNFGKYMGQSVQQILAADPDYIRWIIE